MHAYYMCYVCICIYVMYIYVIYLYVMLLRKISCCALNSTVTVIYFLSLINRIFKTVSKYYLLFITGN